MEFESDKLIQALKTVCDKCDAESISLSGGLDSSILAYLLKERKPKAVSIIASEFIALDLTYCQLIANRLELPLTIEQVSIDDLFDGIEKIIKTLENFNDIEIRNQLTSYFAIRWAKSNGFHSIVTGDGADELFAGYSFLLRKPIAELDSERQRILNVMDFPSKKIGDALGIKVESPFLSQEVQAIAKKIPSSLLVKEENGKMIGKWALRKAFEDKLPKSIVWRKKIPMQDGSGTSGLTEFFNKIITDKVFLEKSKTIKNKDDVEIRTKESLYYYEIFKKFYKIYPSSDETRCPYCRSKILPDSKFCKMCGAYPI